MTRTMRWKVQRLRLQNVQDKLVVQRSILVEGCDLYKQLTCELIEVNEKIATLNMNERR
mgnify:FL=1